MEEKWHQCSFYSYRILTWPLGNNRILRQESDTDWYMLISNKTTIYFNNGVLLDQELPPWGTKKFINLYWSSSALNYELQYNEKSIEIIKKNTFYTVECSPSGRTSEYPPCRVYEQSEYRYFSNFNKISISNREGKLVILPLLNEKLDRISCLVKELKFHAWLKVIRKFVARYRAKRREIILNYLPIDLCKIVEKYASPFNKNAVV